MENEDVANIEATRYQNVEPIMKKCGTTFYLLCRVVYFQKTYCSTMEGMLMQCREMKCNLRHLSRNHLGKAKAQLVLHMRPKIVDCCTAQVA